MKRLAFTFTLFTTVAGATGVKALPAACEKKLRADAEICKKITKLEEFSVEKKSYSVALLECQEDDNETSQYALVENLGDRDCNLLDTDTSFIDYMFTVTPDMKSKVPVAVFEGAIKAELRHQLKDKSAQRDLVERYRKRQALGELTKDQVWVLKYLEGELKK